MTDWKPGQKLEGPNGERAIWLGQRAGGNNAVHMFGESEWNPFRLTAQWTPVDDWSDPVAEARERVDAWLRGDRSDLLWEDTRAVRFVRECAADLRVLLDAEEAK